MTTSMDSSTENQLPIPREYEDQTLLGEGNFAEVVKCVKQSTKKTMAVIIEQNDNDLGHEVKELEDLMEHNMHSVSLPSGINMVQAAAPENGTDLEKTSDLDSETCSSLSSSSDLEEFSDEDSEAIISLLFGTDMVQPGAPENNIYLDGTCDEDSESCVSLLFGTDMVQPAAPKNDTHLEKTCDEDSVSCSSPSSSSDLEEFPDVDSETSPQPAPLAPTLVEALRIHLDNADKKKKKKKNGFKRFLSWMKRAVCPCCNVKYVQF